MRDRGLVAAGLKDLGRPAEVISVPQNLALTATGLIWVRYSFVITPVNYSLAAVNCFVAGTGITSLYRAWECVGVLSLSLSRHVWLRALVRARSETRTMRGRC